MSRFVQRKHPRLKEYDYGQDGCYFITFCTRDRRCTLAEICVGRGHLTPPEVRLSTIGQMVEDYILNMEDVYQTVQVDHFVIMPNHVHLLLQLCGGVRSPRPTDVTNVIRAVKSMTSRTAGKSLWQTSFYDHVVRNREDYLRIWEYIDNNPFHWAEDEYYQRETNP